MKVQSPKQYRKLLQLKPLFKDYNPIQRHKKNIQSLKKDNRQYKSIDKYTRKGKFVFHIHFIHV